MNSYWIVWIGRLRRSRAELAWWAVSAIFEKWPWWSNRIFSFLKREYIVFLIFLLRSIKAYLCPNMMHFDAVDFSERLPEEVISFFWRSVYLWKIHFQYKATTRRWVIWELSHNSKDPCPDMWIWHTEGFFDTRSPNHWDKYSFVEATSFAWT